MPLSRRSPRALAATLAIAAALGAPGCASGAARTAPAGDPARAASALLEADRAFAGRAGTMPVTDGIAQMLAEGATALVGPALVRGRDSVRSALARSPANLSSRMTWTPVRAGISADESHGFTIGYFTLRRADGSALPGKYVAYWERTRDGWRVLAYKRAPRPPGEVDLRPMPPSLPAYRAAAAGAGDRARYAEELAAAERAFSRAAADGIGQAFRRFGAPDATNVGGPDDVSFVQGPEAIARGVESGGTEGTSISWEPEHVYVAPSGDLGVTVGWITVVQSGTAGTPEGPRRVPYLTVWRRLGPAGPWRYVAE